MAIAACVARGAAAGLEPGDYPRGGGGAPAALARRAGRRHQLDAVEPRRRTVGQSTTPARSARRSAGRRPAHRCRRSPACSTSARARAIEPEVDLSGYWIDGDIVRIGAIRSATDARSAPAARSLPAPRSARTPRSRRAPRCSGGCRRADWAGSPARRRGRRAADPWPTHRRAGDAGAGCRRTPRHRPCCSALLPVCSVACGRRWRCRRSATQRRRLATPSPTALVWLSRDARWPRWSCSRVAGRCSCGCCRSASRGSPPGAQPDRRGRRGRRAAARRGPHLAVPALREPVHPHRGCGCSARRSARDVEASTVLLIPSLTDVDDGAFLADDTMVGCYELGGGWMRVDRGDDRQARVPRQLAAWPRPGTGCPKTGWSPCCPRRRRRSRRPGSSWLGSPPPAAAHSRPRPTQSRTYRPPTRLRVARGARGDCAGSSRCSSPARIGSPCCSPAWPGRARSAWRVAAAAGGLVLMVAGAVAARRSPRREVAVRRAGSGPASTRCGRASSGAPRWPTPSPRWSPRRGSPAPPPARRRCVWLRSLGATIGRGVWCDTYWLPEPDLVDARRRRDRQSRLRGADAPVP